MLRTMDHEAQRRDEKAVTTEIAVSFTSLKITIRKRANKEFWKQLVHDIRRTGCKCEHITPVVGHPAVGL